MCVFIIIISQSNEAILLVFFLQGVQSESLPYVYYTPSYGYAESPYNPYNPYIPGAMIGVDGPFAGAQQYYTVPSYQNSASSPSYIPVLVQPDLTSPETLLNIGGPSISRPDARNLKNNFSSPVGNYVRNSSKASNQENSMNRLAEGPKDTNRQAIMYGSIPSGGIQNSMSSRAFQVHLYLTILHHHYKNILDCLGISNIFLLTAVSNDPDPSSHFKQGICLTSFSFTRFY